MRPSHGTSVTNMYSNVGKRRGSVVMICRTRQQGGRRDWKHIQLGHCYFRCHSHAVSGSDRIISYPCSNLLAAESRHQEIRWIRREILDDRNTPRTPRIQTMRQFAPGTALAFDGGEGCPRRRLKSCSRSWKMPFFWSSSFHVMSPATCRAHVGPLK